MNHKINFFTLVLLLLTGVAFAQNVELEQRAQTGDKTAQARLGALLLSGQQGYMTDEAKAGQWLLKAAEQNMLEAQMLVAAMYDRGLGLAHDPDKATAWYERAANAGQTTAQAILGRNKAPAGSVGFSYKTMRLNAARQIPKQYAKRIIALTNP